MLSEGRGALQEENNSGSESRGAKGGTPTCCAPAVFQNKLAGTVWTDIDDARVFKVLDLEDLERTFSAYQRQQVTAGRGPAQASGADAVVVRSLGSTCGLGSCLLPLFHSRLPDRLDLVCPLICMPVPLPGNGSSQPDATDFAPAHVPDRVCRRASTQTDHKTNKNDRECMKIAPRCGHG